MAENEQNPKVEEALEEFDLAEWLDGATSPKDTITVYRDGETLRNLQKLLQYVEQTKMEGQENKRQLLSLADEDDVDELDSEVEEQIAELRAKLAASGLTFEVEGLAPAEVSLIQKKVAKRFKGQKDAEGNEYSDGTEHPDFGFALDEAYISRCVKATRNAEGKLVKKSWTPEEVHQLRYNEETGKGLPANEFSRLSGKVVSVVYLRYDMDQLITQDFS